MGKATRPPFDDADIKGTYPMDYLHSDLVGPFPPSSNGARYIVTVIDDYSDYAFIYTIRFKSQASDCIIDAVTVGERQTGNKCRCIRSDNGREYITKKLAAFMAENGILPHTSAPYTPQLNGKAERFNRTLVEKTCTMIADTHLPYTLWDYAAETAVLLRNCSPVTSKAHTPYRCFWNNDYNYKRLKAFGCRAYVTIPKEKREKASKPLPRSERGRLIGYSTIAKAWLVILDDLTTIRTSRDVSFLEGDTDFAHTGPDHQFTVTCTDPDDAFPAEGPDALAAPLAAAAPPLNGAPSVRVAPATARRSAPPLARSPRTPPPAHTPHSDAQADTDGAPTEGQPPNTTTARGRRVRTPARFVNATVSLDPDMPTLREARARADWPQWQAAIQAEHASLLTNHTYTAVPTADVPPGTNVIPTKIVLKLKRDADGQPERYKARFVARGFTQQYGVDYWEVFSPTAKLETFRLLCAYATKYNLLIEALDITTAFLNSPLPPDQKLYIEPIPGFEKEGYIWKLNKTIYGLKQAPRAWNETLHAELLSMGMKQSPLDLSLYTLDTPEHFALVLVYVDDLIIVTPKAEAAALIKRRVSARFPARDLGATKHFLGIKVERDAAAGTTTLSKRAYIHALAERFKLTNSRPINKPLDPGALIGPREEGEFPLDPALPFAALVGSLLYAARGTRPDIAFAVSALGRSTHNPTLRHWHAALYVLRYLITTADHGLTYTQHTAAPGLDLRGYCDASFAGAEQRKWVGAYAFLAAGAAVSWSSKLQRTTASSTHAAEYMAAGAACREAVALRQLCMHTLGFPAATVPIACDSHGAISTIETGAPTNQTKHIEVSYYYTHEQYKEGAISFAYVPSTENAADVLTKALAAPAHALHRAALGVTARPSSPR